ncbi:MAG: histidine phosphatase family protein [Alphaproteobacteria bacterium]|nr:histidine phosphatase family protein [Alphaproteobacteria bacterium]
MARLYLVRHGEASAAWHVEHDPGLSELGRRQAAAAAQRLRAFGPLDIVSSPLLRARETAEPTARLWERSVSIAGQVAEIPSPEGLPLGDRQKWLLEFMQGGWSKAAAPQGRWREALLAYLAAQPRDAVIFSHFVAINAAVGAALGLDDVISFRPANASITTIEADRNGLVLIERGAEAASVVR